ncbi:MAG: (4Fe-4S)-binding protein [Saprospiraceae bacterium]|nr:(4Fe-4S)-binding protein [Saprospiraceae bacterium]
MSDKKDIVKEYKTDEITVVWKPNVCIHSEKCWRGLPEVFNPKGRPWINVNDTAATKIADQVEKCPSGALSYYWNDGRDTNKESTPEVQIQVLSQGPLMVKGTVEIELADGSKHFKEKQTALCRCGASGNKPFCDGTHRKIDFDK